MSSSKLFTVETTMEKNDYHKFLYISTLLKSKIMILFFLFLTAFLSGEIAYNESTFDSKVFFVFWIILIMVLIVVIIFKIEVKFRQIMKTDKTGIFNLPEILDFYTDFLIVKSKVFEGEIKVKYTQIYKVFETNNYFITYFNATQATLIRKKDMKSEVIDQLKSLYKKNLVNTYKKVNI